MSTFLVSLVTSVVTGGALLVIAWWYLSRLESRHRATMASLEQEIRRLREAGQTSVLPDEVKQEAAGFIKQSFEHIHEQVEKMGADLEQFNMHRNAVREANARGARRTDSELV
jgi:uncharacterized coiled-coil DUF342 family protein